MKTMLFAGIDGGASKTQGALLDSEGRTVAECRMPGSAVLGKPSEAACAVLRGTMDELLSQAGARPEDIRACAIGLNGVDFPFEYAVQHPALAAAIGIPEDKLSLVNDGIVALWGAAGAPAAALIQCGSGFTAAWRRQHGGEELFDHLNAGRILDPRLELLRQVARMIDGRTPASPLKNAVLNHLGLSSEDDFAPALYLDAIGRSEKFGTMPLICQAWREKDPCIIAIMESWFGDLAVTAKAMLARSEASAVTLGGGVVASLPEELWSELKLRVQRPCGQNIGVERPILPPMIGAAIMAAYQAGTEPQRYFEAVVRQRSQRVNDEACPISRKTMANVPVLVFENAGALGHCLATEILELVAASARAGRRFLLGCPGGRSLRCAYQAMGKLAASGHADLSQLIVVMMDDYVAPGKDGYAACPAEAHYSCRRFAEDEIRAVFNQGLPYARRLKREHIWFPDPAQPDNFDERLQAAGGIDLFLLASGATDGHVAFNPPGSPVGSRTRIVALADATRRDNLETFPQFKSLNEVPTHGVSVGLGTIAGLSRAVVLVLRGAQKSGAFRQLQQCGEFNSQWPASIVFRCKDARILVDSSVIHGEEI